MEFKLNEYHNSLTDEQLLDDIKRVAQGLEKNSITRDEYDSYGKYHSGTIRKRFGGWLKALEKAGLEKTRDYNIDNVDLFKNLEEIWIKLGRQPVKKDLKHDSRYSTTTYETRFGTWRKALEAFVEYINEDEDNDSPPDEDENITIEKEKTLKPKKRTKREISERLRFRILLRDGFTCRKCGRSPLKTVGVELHVDHIIPWSKGGETVPENLEAKCKKCNLGKGNAYSV